MIEIFNLYMNNYYDKNKSFIIFFIIICLLFILFESVIAPYSIGKLINNINNPKVYLYYIIGIYTIVYILYYFKKKYETKIIPDLQTYSRSMLFSAIIDKYSENYKSLKMGSTISKINTLTLFFKDCFIHFIMLIMPNIIIMFMLSGLLTYLNFNLGLILFLSSLLILIVVILSKDNIYKYKNKAENYYFNVTDNNLVDIYSSLMNTYLNNNEVKEKERIQNDQNIYNIYLSDIARVESNLSNILYLICIITLIISLYYIITNIPNSKDKILYLILIIYFINSSVVIATQIPWFIKLYGVILNSKKYINNILNVESDNNDQEISTGLIEFKNLNFYYSKDKYILKNINLIIKDREKVGIIGRSGSGKSSLSKILLKFYKYEGDIIVDNKNIKTINTKYLRTKIVYANQKTTMYDISVMDNIKYGNNIESDYIIKLLTDYKLLEVFSGLKDGIYSDSGVQGNNLSGGMQKIVIILRTILKSEETKALIVIFDEPLAGLDTNTRKKVIKLIQDKCSYKTLIVITHDKEILPYMDRIVDLSEINDLNDSKQLVRNIKNSKNSKNSK